MKKLISLAMVALLALGANVSAQEGKKAGATAGGSETAAAGSTIGGIATTNVVIGAVALGVAAAIIANDDDDDAIECAADELLQNGQCVCPTGQVKFNGICTTQELVCNVGDLEGDICVIPPGTLVNGVTTTVTITTTPVLFPQ